MQRRTAVCVAVELVELVRAFMNDDVVAVALPAGRDIGHGQDQRPGRPGFTATPVVDFVHHARLVHFGVAATKFVWIEHHGMPATVPVDTEVKHRQGRLQGEREQLRSLDGERIDQFDGLVGQERLRQLLQTRPLRGWPVRQHRHPREGFRPVVVRPAVLRPPPCPGLPQAPQQAHPESVPSFCASCSSPSWPASPQNTLSSRRLAAG
jgi:hypothetical protein